MTTAQAKDIHDELRERDFLIQPQIRLEKSQNYSSVMQHTTDRFLKIEADQCALWHVGLFLRSWGNLSDGNRQGPMDIGDEVTLRPLREQSKALAKCSVS
jgi:hypothetical protein